MDPTQLMNQLLDTLSNYFGDPITGMPYVQELGPIAIVHATTDLFTGSSQIKNNPFLWMWTTGTQTSADYTVKFQDSRTQNSFSNAQIAAGSYIGTAQNPYIVPQPYLFDVMSQILINVTNASGADNTINIEFHGILPDAKSLQIIKQRQGM
jgi:hypothetical protein